MPRPSAAPTYPAPLGPGSRIAVTAPSSGVVRCGAEGTVLYLGNSGLDPGGLLRQTLA